MRNCGIGGRRGFPFRHTQVVSSVTISAWLPGGVPAIRGACSGQSVDGSAGLNPTGAPSSHFVRSKSPVLVRGVWHWAHTATPSTIYLPRATRLPWLFSGSAVCLAFCVQLALQTPAMIRSTAAAALRRYCGVRWCESCIRIMK
jgi:hypothetical protein